ncbi:GldM family protein [Ferruginibacter sp.]|nr:hypothetical protein [Ferruginibacter sp.]
MTKNIVCALLLFTFKFAIGQNISISGDRNNVLYIGVGNPLTISVENVNPDDVIVKVDKGQLYGGYGRSYVYQGFEPGNVIFTISTKSGSKEIGRQNFRVKNIPEPVILLSKSKNGAISKPDLAGLRNLEVQLKDFDYDAQFSIDSFAVTVFHTENCSLKEFINVSSLFSEELKKELSKMKKSDFVIFKSVFVKGPDAVSRTILPAVFTVME